MAVTSEEMNERATPDSGDQLAWEKSTGPWVGIAAALSAIFMAISFAVQIPLLRDRTKTEADTLQSVHSHVTGYIIGGILQALALFLIASVLWFFYRATKYRRPQIPAIVLVLGVVGPLLFGLTGAIGPFVIKHYATEFVNGANHSNQHAKDLISGSSASIFSILTPAAGLAFAIAMIMTNVNSIRTGLLSTFAGVIGIIGGILFVVPLGPPQLLLFFWLASVSLVLLDRWPGGRGPAWAAAEPIKWPGAMERRGMAPGAARSGSRMMRPPAEPAPDQERTIAADEPVSENGPTRSSRKRKRKQGRKH